MIVFCCVLPASNKARDDDDDDAFTLLYKRDQNPLRATWPLRQL